MSVHKTILVKGFVQGVSYRKHTQRIAMQFGVYGWVRNLSDGSVEACLEGDEQSVDAVIAWCGLGPKFSKVDEVLVTCIQRATEFSDFKILEDRQVPVQ